MTQETENKKPIVHTESAAADAYPENIEKLLQERKKIDDLLREKFSRQITIMFTDIKGSTAFFEHRGDIEGRLMVQQHNDMLFPIIRTYQGRIIKTIGDAIMAAFEDPVMAVRAACALQQALCTHNQGKSSKEQIHIRIGVNTGEGLVESRDIFGDVVNVAARVESLCDADQILVSSSVYDAVRKTDDIICRYVSQTAVKGKAEPLDLYRVIWGEEDIAVGMTRSAPAAPAAKPLSPLRDVHKRLEVDITRLGNNLKVTAVSRTGKESSSLLPYEEMHISMAAVEARCQEVITLLNQASRRGRVSKDILANLREVGQVLFDTLLTPRAKEVLRAAGVEDLVFNIDDTLVQIPWELLNDGEQFLCQKFNMGRIVRTRRSVSAIKTRNLSLPLKMLILADPQGNLINAAEEGRRIREQMDRNPSLVNAIERSGTIAVTYVTEKLRNFDMVHYAGHADYDSADPSNSGWLLAGGKLTSADILKLGGGKLMPALVFCNACQSGHTEAWKLESHYSEKIYGLANAFLLAGVQHYLGTFWEVLDEPSARCAEKFYEFMMEGCSVGEALRNARLHLIREYGEDTIVWASYMLYGDPAAQYCMASAAEEQPEPSLESAGTASLRGAGDKPAPAAGKGAPRFIAKRIALAVSLVVLLLIGTMSVFQWQHRDKPTSDPYSMAYSLLKSNQPEQAQQCFEQIPEHDARRYEGLAAVFFEQGDLDKARAMSARCLEKDPENVYANVINGSILFSEGKLAEAGSLYQQAAQKKHGTFWQRAEALSGLGRIYSAQGDSEKSLTCYSQAATLNPESSIILTNHGTALEKKGNLAEAAALYQKASSINPQDAIALSMLADIQKKQKIAEDQSHNERIDRLIKELADARKRAPAPHPPEEQWTSKPVTMSFVNFQHRGSLSLREGEDEFFIVRLNSLLQENGRVQVLERDLLDKLLEELKLSATDLVDQKKALEVGKLLAARIIATGSILRSGKDLQTSIRLTETETTLLKAAVTETDTDVSRLADKTAQQVLNKIKQAYPIRGYITAVTSGQVQLNIGSETGVHPGMQLKVLPDPVPADKKQPSPPSLNAPAIRITSVDTKTSTAQVVEQGQVITKRMRVEEIIH